MSKKQDERVKQFKRTFDSIDGQAVLKYLEDKYYYQKTYCKGDQYHTAFQEGQREVLSEIRKKVLKVLK